MIKLHVHTLDDSSLGLWWWEYNDLSSLNEIETLIKTLHKLVTETEIFWQTDFLDRL